MVRVEPRTDMDRRSSVEPEPGIDFCQRTSLRTIDMIHTDMMLFVGAVEKADSVTVRVQPRTDIVMLVLRFVVQLLSWCGFNHAQTFDLY